MIVFLASDHGGFLLKKNLVEALAKTGHEVRDLGCPDEKSVDYPLYAALLAEKVVSTSEARGILVCGTGIGMAMAANKIGGIRAAVANELFSARLCRQHNDTNVLCLGGRIVAPALAFDIATLWLSTPFEQGRHQNRIDQIAALEVRAATAV